MSKLETTATCRHCHRAITLTEDGWVDPNASGDDRTWRETCDSHDTFEADHEPETTYYLLECGHDAEVPGPWGAVTGRAWCATCNESSPAYEAGEWRRCDGCGLIEPGGMQPDQDGRGYSSCCWDTDEFTCEGCGVKTGGDVFTADLPDDPGLYCEGCYLDRRDGRDAHRCRSPIDEPLDPDVPEYWSNDHGWVDDVRQQANADVFTDAERETFGLLPPGGRWVSLYGEDTRVS